MSESPKPSRPIVAPLAFFGFTALIAIVLLIWAFVMWLASLTGSVAIAALATGGVFAIVAVLIYLLSVRGALADIRDRLDTIYDVAARVRDGYNWISDKFSFLTGFRRSH